ncbi:hypothetical protein E4U42_001982, partial [Claviceps africana]
INARGPTRRTQRGSLGRGVTAPARKGPRKRPRKRPRKTDSRVSELDALRRELNFYQLAHMAVSPPVPAPDTMPFPAGFDLDPARPDMVLGLAR